jgi:hypothetical protein
MWCSSRVLEPQYVGIGYLEKQQCISGEWKPQTMKRVLVHCKIRGPPNAVPLIKRKSKPYKTEVYWTQSVVHLFCVILSEATALGGFFCNVVHITYTKWPYILIISVVDDGKREAISLKPLINR